MPQMLRDQAFRRMVPVVGLEPTRSRPRRILNPLRLPFHHTGTFYRETPKILIGENKDRTHYKSYILLYLGSLEKSRFLSDFILPDLLAFECLAHVFPPQHSAVLRRPKALQLQAFCGCLLIFQWLHRSPKSSLLTQLGEN